MRSRSFRVDIWAHAAFDPMTLTAASMRASAIGGLASAGGTIAGGNAAAAAGQMQQNAANYQASQLDSNAAQAFASGQRRMLDTQQTTRMAISSARALSAGNGTDAGVGSAATAQGALAQRGSYNAAMDMFNGASTATGLRNQAAGVRYSGNIAAAEGQEQQQASQLAAAGTIAGAAGGMARSYAFSQYPRLFGFGMM